MATARTQKKTYKKKTYKRKGNMSLASLSKKVNALARLTRPEFKVNENQINALGNTAGNITLINTLVRGTDFTNIIGRVATFKSIQWHDRILKNSAVGTNYGWYALVLDKQANEAPPTMDDIWTTAQGQFRNLDNRKRFVILFSKDFTLDADDPERNFKGYHKLDFKTIFDISDTGNILSITSNALYFVHWSNQPTTDGYGFNTNIRLRYTDA